MDCLESKHEKRLAVFMLTSQVPMLRTHKVCHKVATKLAHTIPQTRLPLQREDLL